MNKKNKILILFLYLGLILIFLLYMNNYIPCAFKKIFHIPCPACGLTRAFKTILRLNIIQSLSYNILALPLTIALTLFFIYTVIDIIYNKKYVDVILNTIIKHYYLIIILLLLSWIINIYRKI